jgi:N-acetylneuraminate synthase
MKRTFIIGEIGINHNGDINIAKQLMKAAKDAGCNAVKFQKRNIYKVYSKEQLAVPRESPWGDTTEAQKLGLEFSKDQYNEIDRYAKEIDISWFASAWDIDSYNFLRAYALPYNKVASALLRHSQLLHEIASDRKYTFISTGMSTIVEIDAAIGVFDRFSCPYELLHCNSQYPTALGEVNLLAMKTLRDCFGKPVGFSDHSTGIITSVAAVALGAITVERHITLDRSMYGSDQAASLEPQGLSKMIEYIRSVEIAMGTGNKIVSEGELKVAKKLSRDRDYD